MSDEEVLGQLFMMAYPGDAPPALLLDWITRRGLGGVKIFGWNAEDSTKVAKSGDTMTGGLLMSNSSITVTSGGTSLAISASSITFGKDNSRQSKRPCKTPGLFR